MQYVVTSIPNFITILKCMIKQLCTDVTVDELVRLNIIMPLRCVQVPSHNEITHIVSGAFILHS